jgi:hypothetical protein
LRSCVDSQNNLFRYYLSALDSSRDFSFNSNVINESTFSIFTGNNV